MSNRAPVKSFILLALLCVPAIAASQVEDLDLRMPWNIIAESTSFDGKESMIVFSGLRLSQGRVSIEAEEGRVSNEDEAQSDWFFSGNVIIDVENGHIECEAADLEFDDYNLNVATVTGSPATFRLTRPGHDAETYAEAGKLSYDVVTGVVEFSGDASITEGGNQIASDFLVYYIADQRIEGEGGVRVIYTPTEGDALDVGIPGAETQNEDP